MKRIVTVALAAVVGSALIGLSVAAARPSWIPSWIRDFRTSSSEDAGLRCQEHGVPEKFCTLCHPELASSLMICEEHGVPEDICTLCHPDLEQKYDITMCKEHGLPESFCSMCKNGAEPVSDASDASDDGWCTTHNAPESLCAECLKDPDSRDSGSTKVCRQPLPRVRFKTKTLADEIGVETALVHQERHAHFLSANAETAFDGNRLAEIRPRVRGFFREVRADLGCPVQPDDVLAVVDSSEISAGKSQFLAAADAADLAQVNFERTSKLVKSGAVATKNAFEDQTAWNLARARRMDAEQRLRNFGFSDDAIAQIVSDRDTTSLLPITAPIAGKVVRRHAVQGEAVEPTTNLFAIADTSRMWLWMDIYEADFAKVQLGQPVVFTVSDAEASSFEGLVTWIGAEVDPKTRTTKVRAELTNTDGYLRSNQFGVVEIQVGDEHEAILVPKAAVQHKDGADLVFLPETTGIYRPQRVVTRTSPHTDQVEIQWGLEPGQSVVTTGSYLLKTELAKGAIGAGCCD